MADSFMEATGCVNILVFGNSGAGKSLLCSVLSNNYERFPVSDDMERSFPEPKFFTEEFTAQNHKFCVFDWEGYPSTESFQKMLQNPRTTIANKPHFKIHAIIFVMASGRMCLIEENFMKELMETFFDDNNLRHRLLLVVTHSAEKYIRDIHRAQEWITNESNKPRSLLSYFFNDVNLGQNSCKSRIHFTNFKNPKEEEDPEWAIQANKKIANLILKNIINLPGPAIEISTGLKCFNRLHKFLSYVHSIILPIFQFIVRCITSWINRILGYVGYEQLSDD